jgi:hypothetical protein
MIAGSRYAFCSGRRRPFAKVSAPPVVASSEGARRSASAKAAAYQRIRSTFCGQRNALDVLRPAKALGDQRRRLAKALDVPGPSPRARRSAASEGSQRPTGDRRSTISAMRLALCVGEGTPQSAKAPSEDAVRSGANATRGGKRLLRNRSRFPRRAPCLSR